MNHPTQVALLLKALELVKEGARVSTPPAPHNPYWRFGCAKKFKAPLPEPPTL
jgi:hypothetical protein